jgi:hypothetical protein
MSPPERNSSPVPRFWVWTFNFDSVWSFVAMDLTRIKTKKIRLLGNTDSPSAPPLGPPSPPRTRRLSDWRFCLLIQTRSKEKPSSRQSTLFNPLLKNDSSSSSKRSSEVHYLLVLLGKLCALRICTLFDEMLSRKFFFENLSLANVYICWWDDRRGGKRWRRLGVHVGNVFLFCSSKNRTISIFEITEAKFTTGNMNEGSSDSER